MNKKQYCDTPVIAASIIVGVLCLLIGIVIGMILQQYIIYQGIEQVAPAFSGVEVNIDLNETEIVNGLSQIATDMQQTYGDPHNINIDATCPGRNTTKTVSECIREARLNQYD